MIKVQKVILYKIFTLCAFVSFLVVLCGKIFIINHY